jgi:hypothetical protein
MFLGFLEVQKLELNRVQNFAILAFSSCLYMFKHVVNYLNIYENLDVIKFVINTCTSFFHSSCFFIVLENLEM